CRELQHRVVRHRVLAKAHLVTLVLQAVETPEPGEHQRPSGADHVQELVDHRVVDLADDLARVVVEDLHDPCRLTRGDLHRIHVTHLDEIPAARGDPRDELELADTQLILLVRRLHATPYPSISDWSSLYTSLSDID